MGDRHYYDVLLLWCAALLKSFHLALDLLIGMYVGPSLSSRCSTHDLSMALSSLVRVGGSGGYCRLFHAEERSSSGDRQPVVAYLLLMLAFHLQACAGCLAGC